MNSMLIAALIKEQAPKHIGHTQNRPAEFVEYDGTDPKGTVVVQCSCNVRLTLSVNPHKEPKSKPAANKVVGDGA
jgi:hypothetical protein